MSLSQDDSSSLSPAVSSVGFSTYAEAKLALGGDPRKLPSAQHRYEEIP